MEVHIRTPFSDSIYAPTNHHRLEIDGRNVAGVRVSGTDAGYVVNATSAEGARVLREIPFSELAPTVTYVEISWPFDWRDFRASAAAQITKTDVAIIFKFKPDRLAWTGPIEFERVTDAVTEVAPTVLSGSISVTIDGQTGIFSLRMRPTGSTLASCILAVSDALVTLRDEVEARVAPFDGPTLSFHFPAEVTVACQQYLLYFSEFLADPGVGANHNSTARRGCALLRDPH